MVYGVVCLNCGWIGQLICITIGLVSGVSDVLSSDLPIGILVGAFIGLINGSIHRSINWFIMCPINVIGTRIGIL